MTSRGSEVLEYAIGQYANVLPRAAFTAACNKLTSGERHTAAESGLDFDVALARLEGVVDIRTIVRETLLDILGGEQNVEQGYSAEDTPEDQLYADTLLAVTNDANPFLVEMLAIVEAAGA